MAVAVAAGPFTGSTSGGSGVAVPGVSSAAGSYLLVLLTANTSNVTGVTCGSVQFAKIAGGNASNGVAVEAWGGQVESAVSNATLLISAAGSFNAAGFAFSLSGVAKSAEVGVAIGATAGTGNVSAAFTGLTNDSLVFVPQMLVYSFNDVTPDEGSNVRRELAGYVFWSKGPTTSSSKTVSCTGQSDTGMAYCGIELLPEGAGASVTEVTAGAPTVGSSTLGQVHALSAAAVSAGAPTVSAPALNPPSVHELSANPITAGVPTISAPALGQPGVFSPLGQTSRVWLGLGSDDLGNAYGCAYGADVFIQIGGTGDFDPLGLGALGWACFAAGIDGALFVGDCEGRVWKRPSGGSAFSAMAPGPYALGMCTALNGDIYANQYNGDIWRLPYGSDTWEALNQTERPWTAVCSDPVTGDIYASTFGGLVYKLNKETDDFEPVTGITARNYRGICIDLSGNFWACTGYGYLVKRTGGTGDFASIGGVARNWRCMATATNGYDIYAAEDGGDIYKLTVETAAVSLSAGAIVAGASTVSAPALGQTHSLSSGAVASGSPTIAAPALSQAHALSVAALTAGAAEVGTPALGQTHSLSAPPVATASPTTGAPAVGQTHALSAQAMATSSPTLGAPGLSQTQALTAPSLASGSPTAGAPLLSQIHVLSASAQAAGVPTVAAPPLGQNHLLSASASVTSAPTVGSPVISQTHTLSVAAVTPGMPALGTPALGQTHALAPSGVVAGSPTLEAPLLTIDGQLSASPVAAGTPTLGAPSISQTHLLATLAVSAGSPSVSAPALGQNHSLSAASLLTGTATIEAPSVGQTHTISAGALLAGPPTVSSPELEQTSEFQFTVDPLSAGTPSLGSPALVQVHVFVAGAVSARATSISAPLLSSVSHVSYPPLPDWVGANMPNIYKYDVGSVVQLPLPAAFDPVAHALEGILRTPPGDRVYVTPTITGRGPYVANFVSTRGQLNSVGTYSFSVTIQSRTTDDSKDLDPVFFRVWPRGRHGSA